MAGEAQNLGPGSSACNLDSAGLAEACARAERAIGLGADLVILSKFGKQEADRGGLSDAFRAAIAAGLPVLTAVSPSVAEAWHLFAGPLSEYVLADLGSVEAWWSRAKPAPAPLRPIRRWYCESGGCHAAATAERQGKSLKRPHQSAIEMIVRFANGGSLTPEDLALIEAIRRERSILAASRATGVSYRKCWLMVDALNRTFETPVFATHPGRRGGGAELTPFGERLVALYRSMERRSRTASAQGLAELTASLDPSFEPRASGEAEDRPPQPRLARSPRS